MTHETRATRVEPILLAVPLALCVAVSPAPARADDVALPPALEAALASGRFVGTAPGFRMMALSFLADACAAAGTSDPANAASAHRCVARAHARAERLAARHRRLATSGLWLTHRNLILGAAHRVGPCLDEAAHASMSRTLRARSLADPTAHAPSFAGSPLRWPADQSATLASLARFDRAHGGDLAAEPLARFRTVVTTRAFRADLGIAAARAMGDAVLAARLAATGSLVDQVAHRDRALGRSAESTLAAAIRYLGDHTAP